jgi:hypothetical protein
MSIVVYRFVLYMTHNVASRLMILCYKQETHKSERDVFATWAIEAIDDLQCTIGRKAWVYEPGSQGAKCNINVIQT